jgi:hypothetical protein
VLESRPWERASDLARRGFVSLFRAVSWSGLVKPLLGFITLFHRLCHVLAEEGRTARGFSFRGSASFFGGFRVVLSRTCSSASSKDCCTARHCKQRRKTTQERGPPTGCFDASAFAFSFLPKRVGVCLCHPCVPVGSGLSPTLGIFEFGWLERVFQR